MKTNVQQTSLLAWSEIQGVHLGNMQRLVMDLLLDGGVWTNTEISRALGLPINCVTPRIYELRKLGFVVGGAKRLCDVTGRQALTWAARRD